jgi:organic hydroperoxide reductase OsmC/OhrA
MRRKTSAVWQGGPKDDATAAADAKAGCPVSRVLNAKITMDARLEAPA